MSPDQIDAATTALINISAAIDTYGPGIAVATGGAALAWTVRRIHGHIARRRQERRDRAAAWATQCAVDIEPDRHSDDLHTCQQILHATETARKEKP